MSNDDSQQPTGGQDSGGKTAAAAVSDPPDDQPINDVLQNIARGNISIDRASGVSDYLFGHTDMTSLLAQVAATLPALFPADTRIELGLYNDPEIDDQYLRFSVFLASYDEEVAAILSSVYKNLGAQLAKKSGWIQVSPIFND